MGSLGSKNVVAKTSGESPIYDGRAEDGNFPTVSSATGTFGSDITLNGFFSAKNSSQTFFYKGDPDNVGVALFGNTYKSSLADSYSGNGACLSAPKNEGQTGIGELLTGNHRTITFTPSNEFFFTGVMKIITTDFGDSTDSQIKVFRFRNADGDALMLATPQWTGAGATYNTMRDFIYTNGLDSTSALGESAGGDAMVSGEWVRFLMYYRGSDEINILDGSQFYARKDTSNGECFFQFFDNDRAVNDWRKNNGLDIPVIFKPSANNINMFSKNPLFPFTDNVVADLECPYYARDSQVFEVRLDCLYGNNSMESVVYTNNENINIALESGKIEFARQISRNGTQIIVDTSVVSSRFLSSENVYEFVINSNRQPSAARLARAAV